MLKSLRDGVYKTRRIVDDAFHSSAWVRRPHSMNVEVTSICDAKCIHCPRHLMDRAMVPMDLGLHERIIDEATELGVREIGGSGCGLCQLCPVQLLA